GLPGNLDLCRSVDYKYERLEGSGVFAQTFAPVKSEERDGAAFVLQQHATDDGAVLILQQVRKWFYFRVRCLSLFVTHHIHLSVRSSFRSRRDQMFIEPRPQKNF